MYIREEQNAICGESLDGTAVENDSDQSAGKTPPNAAYLSISSLAGVDQLL